MKRFQCRRSVLPRRKHRPIEPLPQYELPAPALADRVDVRQQRLRLAAVEREGPQLLHELAVVAHHRIAARPGIGVGEYSLSGVATTTSG